MSSRSMGVMKVLCSASTQWCVMVSASCSISLMRLALAVTLAPVDASDRNSRVPSTVSCCVLLEEVEEAGFAGQEASEHGPSFGGSFCAAA